MCVVRAAWWWVVVEVEVVVWLWWWLRWWWWWCLLKGVQLRRKFVAQAEVSEDRGEVVAVTVDEERAVLPRVQSMPPAEHHL